MKKIIPETRARITELLTLPGNDPRGHVELAELVKRQGHELTLPEQAVLMLHVRAREAFRRTQFRSYEMLGLVSTEGAGG